MQTISFKNFEENKKSIAVEVGDALKDIGFFALKDHDVPMELINKAYDKMLEFFTLSEEEKMRFYKEEWHGQVGYTPFGKEKAKDAKIFDLKEFWHVVGPTAKLKNIWPDIPDFEETFTELYEKLFKVGEQVLEAIAIYFEYPNNFFVDMVQDGTTIQRLLHYPPLDEAAPKGAVRAAAHEDINFITILPNATTSGLEVLQKDGSWLQAPTNYDYLIVDSGDMIQNLTNGLLPSTTHRVVNPEKSSERRFSIPFFIHPRGEVSLSPLSEMKDNKTDKPIFKDITAHDYLYMRLKELGLV